MQTQTKRERFFNEALKLIYEKGFKATTMRDIAHRLNFVGVANVYNYIDNKQQLLEVNLSEVASEFNDKMENIVRSSYSSSEKLRAIIAMHCHLPAKQPYKIGLLVNEWRNLKEPLLSKFINGKKRHQRYLQSIIKEGIRSGEFKNIDPYVASNTIISATGWLSAEYAENENMNNPVEMEKQIMDLLFGGVHVEAE